MEVSRELVPRRLLAQPPAYPLTLLGSELLDFRPNSRILHQPSYEANASHSFCASFDIGGLVRLASEAGGVIEMSCAVGDTVADDALLRRVHGGTRALLEAELIRCIHLTTDRTFEQDTKYPLRLLVDIAVKALDSIH